MSEREEYKDVHSEHSDKVSATPVDKATVDETIAALPEDEALQLTDMWNTFTAALGAFRKLAGL